MGALLVLAPEKADDWGKTPNERDPARPIGSHALLPVSKSA